MKKIMKTIIMAAALIAIIAISGGRASASPYQTYNTIGSYYQYGSQYNGYGYQGLSGAYHAPGRSITIPNQYWNYPTTPRGGGFFGGGVGWITGLRAPIYDCVRPVQYSYNTRPACGSGGWYGRLYVGGGYGGFNRFGATFVY